jgi:DnaK suppressor protein
MTVQGAQLKEIERALLERLAQVEAEVRSGLAKSRESNFDSISKAPLDLGDESVADLITDLATAELTRDLDEWRDLRAAQERIGKGTYGACIDCAREIPFERLRVQPGALRCVGCQGLFEKTHAGPGEPSL